MVSWTRAELKGRGKQSFKRFYWSAVIACAIVMILGSLVGNKGGTVTYKVDTSDLSNISDLVPYVEQDISNVILNQSGTGALSSMIGTNFAIAAVFIAILQIILNYFIMNPIYVGLASFFYRNRTEKVGVGELAFAFNKAELFPVVKTMFLKGLYIFLWSLLFVIPGIVKAYQYRMVEYILAERPEISTAEALRLSKEMTQGHKMNMFLLDLSFIGWYFLGAITVGVVNVFYTAPYVYATEAELYDVLKQPFTSQYL